MSTYRGATSHGVALGSLTVLSPQPSGGIVRPTRRDFVADGSANDQGLYVELFWSSLRNVAAYTTILTVFGLHSAKSAEVTIYAKDDLLVWTRYNGLAIRPEPGREMSYRSFPRNITMMIRDLVAL